MPAPSRWLFRYAVFCAACTLVLICLGGIVTSKGVGMAVPDWPTSFGYNMFWLPLDKWWGMGGVHDEHLHRLVASSVGAFTVGLATWIQFGETRPWMKRLGWGAVCLVVAQGLLGGLRVVLDKRAILDSTGGVFFGVCHAALGQLFFTTIAAIAFFLSASWRNLVEGRGGVRLDAKLPALTMAIVGGILVQLLVAATMRHQHAGLAIPDFPLAYGKVWPATDPSSLELYNQRRIDPINESPVTKFQIQVQMAHRILAVVLLVSVLLASWRLVETGGFFARMGALWGGLLLIQFFLGAATIWTNKSADIATAHVAVGALSLMTGALVGIAVRAVRNASFSQVNPCP